MNENVSPTNELRRCRLFAALGKRELKELAALGERRAYEEGELILMPHDPRDGIFAIVEGSVLVTRLLEDGEVVPVTTLAQGEVFGLALLAPSVTPKSALEAASKGCVVYRFPRTGFREFVASHPEVQGRALELAAERLAEMTDRAAERERFGATARVAHEVGRRGLVNPERIVTATHEELARGAGTTRERVTRTLAALRKAGVIAYRPYGRSIWVVDVEGLLDWGHDAE